MRLFKAQMVERVMAMANVPDDVPIENKMVTRAIASAQGQVEQQNFEIRKNVLKYDEVLNRQREVIYGERRRVLEGEDLHEQVRHFMDDTIEAIHQGRDGRGIRRGVGPRPAVERLQAAVPGEGHGRGRWTRPAGDRDGITADFITELIKEDVHEQYKAREDELGERDHARAGAAGRALRAGPQVA